MLGACLFLSFIVFGGWLTCMHAAYKQTNEREKKRPTSTHTQSKISFKCIAVCALDALIVTKKSMHPFVVIAD